MIIDDNYKNHNIILWQTININDSNIYSSLITTNVEYEGLKVK